MKITHYKTQQKTIQSLLILLILGSCFLLAGCNSSPESDEHAFGPQTVSEYADSKNWLALPEKADNEIDIFYLYPTAWQRLSTDDPISCGVDDAMMRRQAKILFDAQATVFTPVGNIYAPYYRQMDAEYALSLSREELNEVMDTIPVQDALAAFDYYMTHYNNGRPFILAGHSQASTVLLRSVLMRYFKEHPNAMENMVAAYIIGYAVTNEFLEANPHLRFAEGRRDTGVVISYNTESPGFKAESPVWMPGAISINPITWTRSEEYAPASYSLGSRIDGVDYHHYADAKVNVDRGVVECSIDPDLFKIDSNMFPLGVLHGGDYTLYYYDLRQNAKDRIDAFMAPSTK